MKMRSPFRRRVSALPPPPRPPTVEAESVVLATLHAIADAPGVPRTPEEILRLVEAERSAWGQRRTPDDAVVVAALAKLVGAPAPGAFGSADAYALAFAAWLEKSDRRLVENRELSR